MFNWWYSLFGSASFCVEQPFIRIRGSNKNAAQKTGKSIVDRHDFYFDSGGLVLVKCSDWSEEMHSADKLTVGILTKQLRDFIQNEAY